nr:uncharacterized mitochondrial protein AtMg00810-like [Tanacetum cinerariifolium]
EQRSSKPGLQSITSGHISSGLDLTYASSTITTQQPSEGELYLLFEAMYGDYIGGQSSATGRTVLPAPEPQAHTAPIPTNSSSHATNVPITSQDVDKLNPNAIVDGNTFVNPFANSSTRAAASSSQQNDSGFELTGFSDADYVGCKDTFKSTSGGAQFLGEKLIKTVNDDVRLLALIDGKKVVINGASIRHDLKLNDAEALEETGDLPTNVQDAPVLDEPSSSQPQRKHKPRRKQRMETEVSPTKINTEEHVPTPSNDPVPSGEDRMQLKELMDLCTNLSNKVIDLENEEFKSFNTLVESSTIKETVVDKEESSKQGRKITDIDADVEVNLENMYNLDMAHEETVLSITAGGELNAANEKPVSAAPTNITTTQPSEATKTTVDITTAPKAKGIVFHNKRSQQQEQLLQNHRLNIKAKPIAQARKNMMIYLKNMAVYKMDYFKGISYEQIRPIFEMEYNKVQAYLNKSPEMDAERIKAPRKEKMEKDQPTKKQT